MTKHLSILVLLVALTGCGGHTHPPAHPDAPVEPGHIIETVALTEHGAIVRLKLGEIVWAWESRNLDFAQRTAVMREAERLCGLTEKRAMAIGEVAQHVWVNAMFACIDGDAS